MISFWVPAAGRFGMEQFIARRTPDLEQRIRILSYESLTPAASLTRGPHVFAGVCQLGPGGREAVAGLHARLAAHGVGPLLNDPARVAGRYELLQRAHAAGLNRFRAWRAAEAEAVDRFPVFLREDAGHTGALTGLLENRRALAQALRALLARGYRRADLLVVEFCDVADAGGVRRMATAFKLGDRIVPAFLLRGRHWMLKYDGSDHAEAAMQESLDFVRNNPHEAWIRRVFALAEVDYGRLDYGVQGELLQAWEINLNPTPGPGPGPVPPPLAPRAEALLWEARGVYIGAMREAFALLDPPAARDEPAELLVQLDPALLARLRSEIRGRRRRYEALGWLHRLYHHPSIGWPFRAAYSWLAPRP